VKVVIGDLTTGAAGGARTVTVTGDPIEVVLWAYGRGDHAHVDFAGEPADVEAVKAAHLTI
jgi:hypothetical protein